MDRQVLLFETNAAVGRWRTLYTKERADGSKLSVAIPPRADAVLVRVDGRSVAIRLDELVHVEFALRAAREGTP